MKKKDKLYRREPEGWNSMIWWWRKKNQITISFVRAIIFAMKNSRRNSKTNTVKLGYNELGYNELGYNELGYNELGYNELGYNELGFNELNVSQKNNFTT